VYISPYCRLVLVPPNFTKFGIRGQLTDVITSVKCLVDRFRGYGVLIPPKLPFIIDLLRRPYKSVAPPNDTVIVSIRKIWHNSAADFLLFGKFPPQFCESCGATYRRNYEVFRAL